MSRIFSSRCQSVVTGALSFACVCLVPAAAWSQDFPNPVETPPVREDGGVFSNLGRNGYGKRPPNPFRVTLNVYSPDSRTLDRGLGTLVGGDVQYDAFTSRLLGGPTLIGIFADFSGGSEYSRRQSAQFDVSVIGVGLMARRIFTESPDRKHFYIGAGAGFYTTRVDIDPAGPQRYEKSDGGLGIRLQGGYQLNKNFYAQLDILSLDSMRTRNADGRFVRLTPSGARFGVGYQF